MGHGIGNRAASPGRNLSAACLMLALCLTGGAAAAGEPAQKQAFVATGNSLYMVFANAVEGQEAAFNDWYNQHAKAVVQLPGFVRVQRFQMRPREGRADPKFRYLVIYEISGDPSAVHVLIAEAVKAGKVQAPDKRTMLEFEAMTYGALTPVW
jgi:hypothetical protein